ncbi:hypothetical protein BG011_001296 [Mortierella polycephala]|uniref:Uncharacterized protein n=1 Tax=Mortierella polycephala TaxID=41804 RepID=A0A9P6TUV2_9FUNG|nr:hypothetical protein BG011_001296 [Mortierella polycephala]
MSSNTHRQSFPDHAVISSSPVVRPHQPSVHQSTDHCPQPLNPLPPPNVLHSVCQTSSTIPTSRASSVNDIMPSRVLSPRATQFIQPYPSHKQEQQHPQSLSPQQHQPPMQPEKQQSVGSSSDAIIDSRTQFWRNPGMKTLIDWYTDIDNYKRLHTVRPTAGNRPGDVRKEIAAFVNRTEGTSWTEATVKAKLQYVKKRFMDAKDLKERTAGKRNLGAATFEGRARDICPVYEKLARVLSGSLVSNGPPPVQAGPKRGFTFDEETEEEISDNDDEPASSDMEAQVTKVAKPGPAKKRNKDGDLAVMVSTSDSFHQTVNQRMDTDTEERVRLQEERVKLQEERVRLQEERVRLQEDTLRMREEAVRKLEKAVAEDRIFLKGQIEIMDRARILDRETLDREREAIKVDKQEVKELAKQLETRRQQLEERYEGMASENTRMRVELALFKQREKNRGPKEPKDTLLTE